MKSKPQGRAMNEQNTKKWWNSANYWVSNNKPKCEECHGHGKVRTDRARGYVGICPTCNGKGNIDGAVCRKGER